MYRKKYSNVIQGCLPLVKLLLSLFQGKKHVNWACLDIEGNFRQVVLLGGHFGQNPRGP